MFNIKHLLLPAALLLLCGGVVAGCAKKEGAKATPKDTSTITPANDTFKLANGVNLQPSYYNGGNVSFGWDLMKTQASIKSVRIEIEPSVPIALAASWISAAQQQGYQVVATYHKYTVLGSDDAAEVEAAANWWKQNYATLAASGPITVNLMNEWGSHNISAAAYAAAYNKAIPIVRTVYKGYIIIDIPGWGQEAQTAVAAVKATNGITDAGVVLSTHLYPGGWNQAKNRWVNTADIDSLLASGHPVMIGEFGTAGNGGADVKGMVQYAKSKGCPLLAWCWNGDGGEMNMVAPKWAEQATAKDLSLNAYFQSVYILL